MNKIKRIILVFVLVLPTLLVGLSVGGCKYSDVAGTYTSTTSKYNAVLKLTSSGKFSMTVEWVGGVMDTDFSGTFTIKDNVMTLSFTYGQANPTKDTTTATFITSNKIRIVLSDTTITLTKR